MAFCTRVSAIFLVLRLQCFVQPAKNYADPLLIAKSGWLLAGILCQDLGNRCKNARRLNFLRVPARNKHWNKSKLFLSCKWRRLCPRFTARVPKFRSAGPKMNVNVNVNVNVNDSIFFHIKAVDTNWRSPLAYLFFLDIAFSCGYQIGEYNRSQNKSCRRYYLSVEILVSHTFAKLG